MTIAHPSCSFIGSLGERCWPWDCEVHNDALELVSRGPRLYFNKMHSQNALEMLDKY